MENYCLLYSPSTKVPRGCDKPHIPRDRVPSNVDLGSQKKKNRKKEKKIWRERERASSVIGPAGGRRTGNLGGWAGFFPGRGSAQRVEKGEELTEPCWTVMRAASVRYVCSTSNRTMNSTIAWDRNTHVRGSHLIELSGRRRLDSIPLPRTPLQSLPPCGRKDTATYLR